MLSTVRTIGQVVPQMRKRGRGRVIQLAGGEATQPFAFMPDYAVTKAALVNLSVSLAEELSGTGIAISTVSTGTIATSGVERLYRRPSRSGLRPPLG